MAESYATLAKPTILVVEDEVPLLTPAGVRRVEVLAVEYPAPAARA